MFTCSDVARAAGLEFVKRQGDEDIYRCPVHKPDKNPSFKVNRSKDIFACFPCNVSGTAWSMLAFVSRLDPNEKTSITKRAKELGLLNNQPQPSNKVVESYVYTDDNGVPLFRVVRCNPKIFFQQRANPRGGFLNGIGGVRRVPYNLPQLMKASYVFIVEGEKDCKTLSALKLTATTNPGGAGKWLPEFAQYFNKTHHVVIIPDADEPGRKHAEQVANSLSGKVASVKILELPAKDVSEWLNGKDREAAAEELAHLAEGAPLWKSEAKGEPAFEPQVWDIGNVETWAAEPLEWLVDGLISKGGIGFLSGAPKDGKTLLALDLCIHLAQGKMWLNRFKTSKAPTLYVAREDTCRRLKDRILEINSSYGYGPLPSGSILFLIRERFNLMDEVWITWLREQVRQYGFEFLILDVLNRMIPELDELSARDMARMVDRLEILNRELGLTVLNVDHTRKPVGPKSDRDNRGPNPFDLKGSVAKYGCADFMLCLSRTEQERRLQLYCENKDTDERPHLLIDVSPKDSGKPKFIFAGDVEKFGDDMKAKGDANRQKVLDTIPAEWTSPKEIYEKLSGFMKPDTVSKHFNALELKGLVARKGKTKSTMWRSVYRTVDETDHPVINEEKGSTDDESLFN